MIRVLYAEDDPLDIELTRSRFAECAPDIELDVVSTADQLFARISVSKYDLILLDNHLPDRDGIHILRELVRIDAHPPVVMITGVGDETVVIESLRLGAADYVAKRAGYLASLPETLRRVVADAPRFDLAGEFRRVLYIEHNQIDVELTLRHFGEHAPHFSVVVCRSSGEGLEHLALGEPYDLVLCDLYMLGYNAIEFLQELRRSGPSVPPFVVITSQGDEQTALAAMRLGASGYVVKRAGYLEQLPIVIDHAIDHARLRRETEQNGMFRAIVETAADAILVVDADTVVYANPASRTLWHPRSLEGSRLSELFDPGVHGALRVALDHAIERRKISPVRLMLANGVALVEVSFAVVAHRGRSLSIATLRPGIQPV